MSLETILKQLGFSENENKVYLACLSGGVNSAMNIAQRANLKRTTAYSVLEGLVERGLVGKSQVKGKTKFLAEPPEKLLDLVNNIQKNIEAALPELEAVYNKKGKKPKIVFFEGNEAIQNVYDDTVRESPDEILEWNTHQYFEKFSRSHGYVDKRVAKKIKAKRLAGSGSLWETHHQKHDTKELSETLIVPKEIFWPEIEVNIYNDKVAFMNYADEMSVIIESKAIAQAMRQAYHLSWLGAKTIEIK